MHWKHLTDIMPEFIEIKIHIMQVLRVIISFLYFDLTVSDCNSYKIVSTAEFSLCNNIIVIHLNLSYVDSLIFLTHKKNFETVLYFTKRYFFNYNVYLKIIV